MPTLSSNTRKTIQEISRVFNRLATELASELTQARSEIDSLRKEVHKLRSGTARSQPNRASRSPRTPRAKANTRNSPGATSHSSPNQSSHKTGNTVDKHGDSKAEYIFPREPFNPPAPQEPTPPTN